MLENDSVSAADCRNKTIYIPKVTALCPYAQDQRKSYKEISVSQVPTLLKIKSSTQRVSQEKSL